MGKQWAREQAKTNELATVVEQAGLWLRHHPQTAVWGGIGVVAAVLLSAALLNRQSTLREETWSKLSIARTYAYGGQPKAALEQIKSLTETYPTSVAAGYGLLLAGDLLFQRRDYKQSVTAYKSLLEAPPHESLAPMAMAGLSLSQESAGDCRASADTGQSFLDLHPDHFLAPQVHASLARCLGSLGRTDQAKATFERMQFLYPNTYWAEWAKVRKG